MISTTCNALLWNSNWASSEKENEKVESAAACAEKNIFGIHER
jgi:hypothetical protein